MQNCSIKINYHANQQKQNRPFKPSIFTFSILGFISNLSTIVLVLRNPQLKQTSICSLKLFFFNTAECLYVPLALLMEYLDTELSRDNISIFFMQGQVIAIGLIITERILLAKGSMATFNQVTKKPSKGKYYKILVCSVLIAVILNILMSIFLFHYTVLFLVIFAVLDILLYVSLFITLSRMKSQVKSAISRMRKKALMYVTVLFLGFVIEALVIIYMRNILKDIEDTKCPRVFTTFFVLILHVYLLRYIFDPVSFFLFNGLPREIMKTKAKSVWKKMQQRKTATHVDHRNAFVVPM